MAKNERTPVTMLGREWVEWLNEYPVGEERLNLSWQYLNSGAVQGLKVDGNTVEARVQASKDEPYRVVLHFLPVDSMQWDLLWSLLTPEALRDFRSGSMGPVIRNAFAVSEVNPLPERYKDVKTICTCSEWLRPCKHALAVLRALGEEIEMDPMLLLRLRGGEPKEAKAAPEVEVQTSEPLLADDVGYWGGDQRWEEFEAQLLAGGAPARLLKRLGPVSVYGVRMEPDSMFKPVYEGVASEAKVMLEGIRKKVKR